MIEFDDNLLPTPFATRTPLHCLECRTVTYEPHPTYPQLCRWCGWFIEQREKVGEGEDDGRRVKTFAEVCAEALYVGQGSAVEARWRIG